MPEPELLRRDQGQILIYKAAGYKNTELAQHDTVRILIHGPAGLAAKSVIVVCRSDFLFASSWRLGPYRLLDTRVSAYRASSSCGIRSFR